MVILFPNAWIYKWPEPLPLLPSIWKPWCARDRDSEPIRWLARGGQRNDDKPRDRQPCSELVFCLSFFTIPRTLYHSSQARYRIKFVVVLSLSLSLSSSNFRGSRTTIQCLPRKVRCDWKLSRDPIPLYPGLNFSTTKILHSAADPSGKKGGDAKGKGDVSIDFLFPQTSLCNSRSEFYDPFNRIKEATRRTPPKVEIRRIQRVIKKII